MVPQSSTAVSGLAALVLLRRPPPGRYPEHWLPGADAGMRGRSSAQL